MSATNGVLFVVTGVFLPQNLNTISAQLSFNGEGLLTMAGYVEKVPGLYAKLDDPGA